jgi:hypothetical protein
MSTVAGAAIAIQPCTDLPIQQWTEVNVKSPYVHNMNLLTKMCLDARGGGNPAPVNSTTLLIPTADEDLSRRQD